MELSDLFDESFRQGVVAGYVFAATFSIVFIMAYYVPTHLMNKRRRRSRKNKEDAPKELKQKSVKEIRAPKQKKARQKNELMPVKLLDKGIEFNAVRWSTFSMTFASLCRATNYFSDENIIRVGMTGIMYKATLLNGLSVAVKRLYDSDYLSMRRFELEATILVGNNNPRNIVPLVGFCIEEERKERILVYEYMSNGRLSDWLNDDTTILGFPVVFRIALGVARGLTCLHQTLHFAHVNISSDCILLGSNFEPKISNFRGAILVNRDDLAGKNSESFEKDVYDFGTLLFELIRGKKFGQISDGKDPFDNDTYPTNMLEDPHGFYDAMNKSLNEREFEDEVSALLRVACDCVHPLPNQRPTMVEVYNKMSNIWERDGLCEDS